MHEIDTEKLTIWKITPNHEDLGACIKEQLERLDNKSDDSFHGIDATEFPPKEGEIFYAVGYGLTNLVGIAKGFIGSAQEQGVGLTSSIVNQGLVDTDGVKIKPHSLESCDIYRNYSGQGNILYLHHIAVKHEHKGIGSLMLKHMQDGDFEMIETHALTQKELGFFEKNNFQETNLDIGNVDPISRRMVLVWNNPKYKQVQKAKKVFNYLE